MKENAPREVAGVPFVEEVPLGERDIEFLQRYIKTKQGEARACTIAFWIYFLAFIGAIWLTGIDASVLPDVLTKLLFFVFPLGTLICLVLRKICRARFLPIEADLQENRLWCFEGSVTDSTHPLVKNLLLRGDAKRVRIEVLAISGKLHRVNNSMLWTWFDIAQDSAE